MRYKTEETNQLLKKLHKLGPEPQYISELGFRECGAIPDFFALCVNWNQDYTWNHLCKWLQQIPIADLAWLDCEFRGRTYMLGYEFSFDSELPLQPRCLISCVRNGHQREKALCSLKHEYSGEELPFLLLRLNDWVTPVQRIAAELVRNRLKRDGYVGHFLKNIFLIERLKDCLRGTHSSIINSIYEYIANGDPNRILKVVKEEERHATCAAFNLYEETFPDNVKALVQASLKSSHPRLHLKCSSKIEALNNVNFMDVLPLLLNSRPPLRAAATLSFCKRFPDQQLDFLKGMLLDSGAFVRDTAVWKLKKEEADFDVAQFYRDSLNAEVSVSAIIALGQFGSLTDNIIFRDFLTGVFSRKIKKAALESLIRIEVEDSTDLLFHYLPEEGFSKITTKLLASRITANDKDRLLELYINGSAQTRRKVIKLLTYLPDEEEGLVLMKLAVRYPEITIELLRFLRTSSFYCARITKKQELLALYDDNLECFDTDTQKILDFLFKGWR
jgi:hypothetical protein